MKRTTTTQQRFTAAVQNLDPLDDGNSTLAGSAVAATRAISTTRVHNAEEEEEEGVTSVQQKKRRRLLGAVLSSTTTTTTENLTDRLLPQEQRAHDTDTFAGGECEFEPAERDPWIQDNFDDDSPELLKFMGLPLPQSKCFGCLHLNPISSMRKPLASIERNRLDQLETNLTAAIGIPNLNQTVINLAQQYKDDIQTPTNAHRKPGQAKLPDWNPATIKLHITDHLNNPLYRRAIVAQELKKTADLAHSCLKEVHPVKRKRDGSPMLRVNPVQWKVYKEAIELEMKFHQNSIATQVNNWDEMRSYTQKNGADFIDINQKNIYFHVNQNLSTKAANGKLKK